MNFSLFPCVCVVLVSSTLAVVPAYVDQGFHSTLAVDRVVSE